MSDAAVQKHYLDERVIYVFIRQDVEVKHQLVQALHAMRVSTIQYESVLDLAYAVGAFGSHERERMKRGIPFLTTVGMPDAKGMDKVIAKLQANTIAHTAFHDTDYQFGVIGIVTEPLELSVREKPDGLMCNYRLWNPANNTGGDDPIIGYRIGVIDGMNGVTSRPRAEALREIFAADAVEVLCSPALSEIDAEHIATIRDALKATLAAQTPTVPDAAFLLYELKFMVDVYDRMATGGKAPA